MTNILGIDIGGSGIKAALVDITSGELTSDRHRVDTPRESTPVNMASAVRDLVDTFDYSGPVGCCFPAAIIDGEARTAANIDKSWRGTRVDTTFSDATGLPFVVLNDADAAGVAEMQLGAGRGLDGLVLTITIGTGIGSGMFYNGILVPNLEIGHMPGKDGTSIENYSSDRARKENNLAWDEWGERLNYFLEKTVRVMTPDHFILGGGASKKFDRYGHTITVKTPIHIAEFRNNAGIIGAALQAGGSEAGVTPLP